jgi:hypothetical protein
MVNVPVLIAFTWCALMLTYLLGDVLRIFNGDFEPGKVGGSKLSQAAWMGIAAFMLIPIVMMLLSLVLPTGANRWVNTIVAGVLILFNAFGVPTYPGWYDKLLIVVGLLINGLTILLAWTWL